MAEPITVSFLTAPDDSNGNPRRGWEIFIGPRSIAFVRYQTVELQELRDALVYLGVPDAQFSDWNVESFVFEFTTFSAADYDDAVRNDNWDDLVKSGALLKYQGCAA
jgi:hypothetical protein